MYHLVYWLVSKCLHSFEQFNPYPICLMEHIAYVAYLGHTKQAIYAMASSVGRDCIAEGEF